jgi:hypothetical protein
MQFILTGFTQDAGFRVFAFEGIAADRSRTEFTVRTDLSLVRRYGIQMQDLPLLCRTVLEERSGTGEQQTYTFGEDRMRLHASNRAAALSAAQEKKLKRRLPPAGQYGSGWRTQQQQRKP